MIDYDLFCKIHDCHERQGLSARQIARILGIDRKTVSHWVKRPHFQQRTIKTKCSSVLDPFKGSIIRLLDKHAYSAQQIYQQLHEEGYSGSLTLLRNYVRTIRPVQRPVYLKLTFEPGEVAQVDWGELGTISVGNTTRRLSFFVMVLAYSRMLYVEFTVSQTMEHFLSCHQNAFITFGHVPKRIMVDNLKSAVIQRLVGEAPVYNNHYLDFARHYGFEVTACNVRSGNEKGRVESGVGYVKKNFLNGLDLKDFSAVNPAAKLWLDTIANVRTHGETLKRPVDLFEQERTHLLPLNPNPYDCSINKSVTANSQFRFTLDTNHYSVPASYAHRRINIKIYPDRLCVYFNQQLITTHKRCYDRHQDIENPDHAKALLAQRGRAREQRLMMNFLALSSHAQEYYDGMEQRLLNVRHHIRRILALAQIYAPTEIERAIHDGLEFHAFSADYITNILEMRSRPLLEPGPLQLTRHQDLLDLEIAPPNLSAYEDDHETTN
jgi:transposase